MRTPNQWLLSVVILSCLCGCASFGRRGPSPEKLADCRDLTRQGTTALESGQVQQAELLLKQALQAAPDDPEALRWMAEVLWRRNDTDAAIQHLSKAMQARPNDAKLVVRAGELLLANGDREAALAYAERAIRLDPQLGAAWALRGRVFWQLNQPERALADLHRALEFAPQNSEVLWDVAVLYRQRGQPGRCLSTLHELRDSYPLGHEPHSIWLMEGQTLLELGRPYQAVECLLTAVERAPTSAEALYWLAQAQLAAGRSAEATTTAQRALAVDSNHVASRQLLARLTGAAAPAPQRR
jgi:tetratricopeptide (TPR) repeat protein